MTDLKQRIRGILPSVVEFRRDLHRHPEIAYEEVRTAGLVVEALRELEGFDLREGVAGTGVVATLDAAGGGPCIALRADMDALPMTENTSLPYASAVPGMMHACGHDGHTACLLGTAMVLASMREQLPGPVKFIFQPAEEGRAGGRRMVEEGALKNPDVACIFGLHGWPSLRLGTLGTRPGTMLATNDELRIRIIGKATHAAFPHHGIDVVLLAAQLIQALHTIVPRNIDPLDSALLSLCQVHAGSAFNILPDEAEIVGTIRALSEETRELLYMRIRSICAGMAAAHGAQIEVSLHDSYPAVNNDPAAVSFGRGVLGEWMELAEPASVMGGEDFAFYAQEIPACFFFLGLDPDGDGAYPGLHQTAFDFNDDALPYGMEAFCRLALAENRSALGKRFNRGEVLCPS